MSTAGELFGFDYVSAYGMDKAWIVVGWFTPDYRMLADRFACGLRYHGIPHHLFSKPMRGEWDTSQKAAVVLEAMALYPGKAIVLMDVDCEVTGDIEEVTRFAEDVKFNLCLRRRRRERVTIYASSRVMVFRPTEAAKRFAEAWAYWCDGPEPNDEVNLTYSYIANGNVSRRQLELAYYGWERNNPSAPENALIWHDSEHAKAAPTWKQIIRLLERPFRSGRTKAIKAAGAALANGGRNEATHGLQKRPLRVNTEGPLRQDL